MTRLPRMRTIAPAVIVAAAAALAASTVEAAIEELQDEEALRERRRIEREPRGASVGRMQCGGCRRFLIAANEECSCGFRNDVRGRRNVGGYA
jgi:hypothetical protein